MAGTLSLDSVLARGWSQEPGPGTLTWDAEVSAARLNACSLNRHSRIKIMSTLLCKESPTCVHTTRMVGHGIQAPRERRLLPSEAGPSEAPPRVLHLLHELAAPEEDYRGFGRAENRRWS